MAQEASAAIRAEHQALRSNLKAKLDDLQNELTTIDLQHGADNRAYVIRTSDVALSFHLYATAPTSKAGIVVQEFDAPLILPAQLGKRMFMPGEEPKEISRREFYFDFDSALGWCWRSKRRGSTDEIIITTPDLAEYLIKRLFELHEDFKNGKMVRHRESTAYRISSPRDWMG